MRQLARLKLVYGLLFVSICIYLLLRVWVSHDNNIHISNTRYKLLSFANDNYHKHKLVSFHIKPGPRRRVFEVDCKAVIDGSKPDINKGLALMSKRTYSIANDSEYVGMTADCDRFKHINGYSTMTLSPNEVKFPIAYSILFYKDVEQVERLLRAIYRPSNVYCLHVDADSNHTVHMAAASIANCFDNVFIATRKEFIVYAGFSRLQADLNCMADLLNRGDAFKYFINLPSQQFPLKTNHEIVRILSIYNGANDIEGLTGHRMVSNRYRFSHIYQRNHNQIKASIIRTNLTKYKAPHNIKVVKGSAYGVFSREFVKFVMNNKIARELLDWFRDVYSPDEYYWATLHYNPQIGTPGAFYGEGKPDDNPWLSVYVAWVGENPCAGKFVRGVCVFGLGDIQKLVKMPHLFANKFYINYQPLAFNCMEEWLYNRTFEPFSLNLTYYRNLPFIYRKNIQLS